MLANDSSETNLFGALANQLWLRNNAKWYSQEQVKERANQYINSLHNTRNVDQPSHPFIQNMSRAKGKDDDLAYMHAVANAYKTNIQVYHHDRLDTSRIEPVSPHTSFCTLYIGSFGNHRYVSLHRQSIEGMRVCLHSYN